MPILTSLFNILVCICPCVDKTIYWTSTKFKHLIGNFGTKYTSIDDKFDDDEKEFNWWTKYYGFKYQEVVKYKSLKVGYKL